MSFMKISLIVAMTGERVIGQQNKLPWHLPADLKYFKAITMGKPIIMGRKTFESIGKALPGRRNLIISRNPDFYAADCEVFPSLAAALKDCVGAPEVMIIGGAQLFVAALPIANRIYLTEVHAQVVGDTYFPNWNSNEWQEISRIDHHADDKNSFPYSFIVLDKVINPVAGLS